MAQIIAVILQIVGAIPQIIGLISEILALIKGMKSSEIVKLVAAHKAARISGDCTELHLLHHALYSKKEGI